jgi:hypothetical protein
MTSMTRQERHGKRGTLRGSRRSFRRIIALLAALGMLTGSYYLSSLHGDRTLSIIYNRPWLVQLGILLLPGNLTLSYGGETIANRERTVQDPAYSGGSMAYTSSPNAEVAVSFEGDRIEWAGYTGPYGGLVDVRIDGVHVARVDLYEPVSAIRPLYQSPMLAGGVHTMTLHAEDVRNRDSNGNAIHVDYFEIRDGAAVTRLENDDDAVRYTNANAYYYVQFLMRKLAHYVLFAAGTAVLMGAARWAAGRQDWRIWLIPAAMLLWAAGDELHQALVPGRHPTGFDIAVDAAGIGAGALAYAACTRLRRRPR